MIGLSKIKLLPVRRVFKPAAYFLSYFVNKIYTCHKKLQFTTNKYCLCMKTQDFCKKLFPKDAFYIFFWFETIILWIIKLIEFVLNFWTFFKLTVDNSWNLCYYTTEQREYIPWSKNCERRYKQWISRQLFMNFFTSCSRKSGQWSKVCSQAMQHNWSIQLLFTF